MSRAIIGPGDLPLIIRAERVPLSMTRGSITVACMALGDQLAGVELELSDSDGIDERQRVELVARRIALIDALAELRGQR